MPQQDVGYVFAGGLDHHRADVLGHAGHTVEASCDNVSNVLIRHLKSLG